MLIIKKHNDHSTLNTTPWYHVWRKSIDFVVSWTQRQKVTAKVDENKIGCRRPRSASLVLKRRYEFEWAQGVWWSQVMHLMHLYIVSLACRFCILVANLIFLESQILLSSAREDLLVRNSTTLEVNNLCHSFSSEFQNILAETRSTFNIHQYVFSTVLNSSLLDAWFL